MGEIDQVVALDSREAIFVFMVRRGRPRPRNFLPLWALAALFVATRFRVFGLNSRLPVKHMRFLHYYVRHDGDTYERY